MPMNEKKAGGIEPDLVRELASILRDAGLSEIEIEQGDLRLRLARGVSHAPAGAPLPPALATPAPAPVPAAAAPPAADAKPADAKNHPGAVLSPMVGTAYLSPEPGAAVFVKQGDKVSEGQTLMVVEAMKTFNPIPAPRAGTLAQVLVSDGQPIEFGQPLAILD